MWQMLNARRHTIQWSRSALLRGLWSSFVLAICIGWALQAESTDSLRAAQHADQQGHLHRATALYQHVYAAGRRDPVLLLRLAQLRAMRGENAATNLLLVEALQQQPPAALADQLWLLYGWNRLLVADEAAAQQAWSNVSPTLAGAIKVLQAEAALRQGQLDVARELLNGVGALPEPWRTGRDYRAAQLTVSHAPSISLQLSAYWGIQPANRHFPGLPQPSAAARSTLSQIATLEDDARRLGLAQWGAAEGLPQAASTMLQAIDPASQYAPAASEYRARIQWTQGNPQLALQTISAAAERYPQSAAIQRTKAQLAATVGDLEQASQALVAAVAIEPLSPENYTTVAALALAQRDYERAIKAYDLAIASAPVSGTYELQAANFYLNTPLRACTDGQRYIQAAFNTSVDQNARRMAADLALQCAAPQAALDFAATLLHQSPDDPQLNYLYGAAHWQLGNHARGRPYLERAADLAPGTSWMQRAEALIGKP